MIIEGNSTVCVVKDQVTCDLSGEAVILQLRDSMYYGLNPVGASIWKLIQTPRTVTEVRDAILQEYGVDAKRCECDLRVLLKDLHEHRLIEVVDGNAAATPAASGR